jgi:hypothetical protein
MEIIRQTGVLPEAISRMRFPPTAKIFLIF